MTDAPPATLWGAFVALTWRPHTPPAIRWGWTFAVLALRTRRWPWLSRRFFAVASRIAREALR